MRLVLNGPSISSSLKLRCFRLLFSQESRHQPSCPILALLFNGPKAKQNCRQATQPLHHCSSLDLLQTELSLTTPAFARTDGRCKVMTSGCHHDVPCLGKGASDASICSEGFRVEDLPLHQEPGEAYKDFGGRFTRTPEGRSLVVLHAELLTDREGRVSAFELKVTALAADALSQQLTACTALTSPCHS